MKNIAVCAMPASASSLFLLFFWASAQASPAPAAPLPPPALAAGTPLPAAPLSGVRLPGAQLPGAQLSGAGTLRFLGLRVYEARLWVRPGFAAHAYADQPFALELHYARSFSADAIASRSIDEMRRQQPLTDAQAARWHAALAKAIPSVQGGDELIGLHTPAGSTRFWHNGVETGQLDDPLLSRLFFGIWLSPQSSEPALRAQLLALP